MHCIMQQDGPVRTPPQPCLQPQHPSPQWTTLARRPCTWLWPHLSLSLVCCLQDGRTALHYAARWASQNAASALLAASASFTTVDNSGKTPMHLAVAAPVQEVDELTKQAMIKQGQRASEFVYCNNV